MGQGKLSQELYSPQSRETGAVDPRSWTRLSLAQCPPPPAPLANYSKLRDSATGFTFYERSVESERVQVSQLLQRKN